MLERGASFGDLTPQETAPPPPSALSLQSRVVIPPHVRLPSYNAYRAPPTPRSLKQSLATLRLHPDVLNVAQRVFVQHTRPHLLLFFIPELARMVTQYLFG
jgi:hypothetical protein